MADSSTSRNVVDNPDTTTSANTSVIPSDEQPIMTPQDIEALFESSKHRQQNVQTVISLDDDEDESLLPDEELSWRVEQLSRVLSTLTKLLESGSIELDAIAQKLGDGSRDASWRLPLGQSGILEFFLGLIGKDGLRQTVTLHALRVIGNSCADTDENRARVVASNCMPRIVNLINDDTLLNFAIPVLFNICVDYEPTQVAAFQAGINPELVTLISGPRSANATNLMNIICKLLALVANQEPEANYVHPATPFVLLKLATSPESLADVEDFLGQASVALTYLSNQTFQDAFLQTPHSIPLFLKTFSEACTSLDLNTSDPDEIGELRKVKSIFTQALADLSANPLFAAACPIGSPEIQTLQEWIGGSHADLQSAACLALGNIARSDEVCIALVQETGIHRTLAATISNPSVTDAQLLHSALSFLKNLAIPVVNKAALGEAGLLEPNALPRIWELDTQIQVQFTSVSLTRLLLVSSPENVKRICSPVSADQSSPAHEKTYLHNLLKLFMRSDQEPTKTEAARAVAAALKIIHSSSDPSSLLPTPSTEPSPDSSSSALQSFYSSHETFPNALIFLGTQPKFPVLRSDLWFVLALMSRSPPGADVAATCLQHVELLRSLTQTVTGEDMLAGKEAELLAAEGALHGAAVTGSENLIAGSSHEDAGMPDISSLGVGGVNLEPQQADPAKQKAGMARVDRENGLVLIAELLRRCPDKLRLLPQDTFREILRAGGEQVLTDRAAGGPQ
ncbi:armadillo-type protein [Pestalotiopsis sp. NC0098]|nr:armadillo-type protein [Pestalotiopsis sp. NC0098]